MIADIAAYAKEVAPNVKIIGVEAEGANLLEVSLQQNSRVAFPSVNRFNEEDLVDDVVTESTDEICSVIKDVFGDTRSLMEPTERLDDRERFVAVKIPEKIGSFHELYTIIYPYNVTEFSYRMDSESDKEARIWMSIQTKTHDEFVGVVTAINKRSDMHAI
ncbi:hypothetical protein PsorP6_006614 [Peronosclerospora sorghi]|uniref:Uncharacterized protein n=1 Tax=Peronosclerospora sorghi TaxID=230839 RepID=A0ACC0W3J9_9STRA|nr:hypothetical protein PsorP6_006614 [Peronosclerospora sorghi]